MVIYAGSLVNPALLAMCRQDCAIYNSAEMTLEQVLAVMRKAEAAGKHTVRLHTGDPCVYGAILEQMDALDEYGLQYAVTPGISSFCGAAAAAEAEYTLPGVSQSVILTRMAGRTPVPERESIASLAAHGASMTIFLSSGMLEGLQQELLKGAYTEGYTGGPGLQGHLARTEGAAVHHGHIGPHRRRCRHPQDGAGAGGRFSRFLLRAQQAVRS
ncbi:MAG: cobalt-precorrin-4/precorrin-4 C(11)-methyltransferase [Firmicutes bacterium]|nr:cobalt-precorrin-4/precorrin-4 C(11)-methyltransferase [Bacillota bacterium]